MPTIIDEAICVRHWDFSETSQTVSLLTRSHGMLRGLAKGSRRERGRFSGGIDLLTRGQVVALTKPGRELATLTDWDLLEMHRVVRERLDANSAAFYAAELVCRLLPGEAPHPEVFDALARLLRELADPLALDVALLRFQWSLLEACGFRPRLEAPTPPRAAGSARRDDALAFDPAEGGVVDPAAAPRAWPVRRATIEALAALAEGELDDRLDPAVIRRAARLLAAYARALLGHEPATMRAVFGEIPTAIHQARPGSPG